MDSWSSSMRVVMKQSQKGPAVTRGLPRHGGPRRALGKPPLVLPRASARGAASGGACTCRSGGFGGKDRVGATRAGAAEGRLLRPAGSAWLSWPPTLQTTTAPNY
eukprot:2954187-Rhodomonas_salina.4